MRIGADCSSKYGEDIFLYCQIKTMLSLLNKFSFKLNIDCRYELEEVS